MPIIRQGFKCKSFDWGGEETLESGGEMRQARGGANVGCYWSLSLLEISGRWGRKRASGFSHLRVRKPKHLYTNSCSSGVRTVRGTLISQHFQPASLVAKWALCWWIRDRVGAKKMLLDIQNNIQIFFSKIWHFYHFFNLTGLS